MSNLSVETTCFALVFLQDEINLICINLVKCYYEWMQLLVCQALVHHEMAGSNPTKLFIFSFFLQFCLLAVKIALRWFSENIDNTEQLYLRTIYVFSFTYLQLVSIEGRLESLLSLGRNVSSLGRGNFQNWLPKLRVAFFQVQIIALLCLTSCSEI